MGGFVVMVLELLLTALQANLGSLESWLVALLPVVGRGAYVALAYTKARATLIGASLIPFIVLIVNIPMPSAVTPPRLAHLRRHVLPR